jgi:hypothetical protein
MYSSYMTATHSRYVLSSTTKPGRYSMLTCIRVLTKRTRDGTFAPSKWSCKRYVQLLSIVYLIETYFEVATLLCAALFKTSTLGVRNRMIRWRKLSGVSFSQTNGGTRLISQRTGLRLVERKFMVSYIASLILYGKTIRTNTYLEAMRTCLADPNCRHILVASWKTPCGVYFKDPNQPEADAKITFTHCLPGFIPVNHYWERLDPHRGASYITTTEFNRCYMSTFVDFTDTEEDMDTFHDTPDSEEVTKVKERLTQPFPACEVGTKCMRFACPFSHVCHTTGCRELLDQRPCPSGFGAEQHHEDEMGSSMEWGSWDRADSIPTRWRT